MTNATQFLKKLWGSGESNVFRASAWAVAIGLAVATSYRPSIDWSSKSVVDEHNKKIKEQKK